jgi:hypothetical protein
MSLFEGGVRGVGTIIRARAEYGIGRVRRVSAGPALLRLTATLAAFVALILAVPQDVLFDPESPAILLRLGSFLFIAGIGVGLFPRTRWVSLMAIAAVLGWLVSTLGFGDPVDLVRVGLLTAALYLMHAASAMAAVLPYDCVVAPAVLVRWAARTAALLAIGLVVGLGGAAIVSLVPSTQTVVGAILGAVVGAILVGVLAWQLRRRSVDQ